MPKSTDSAQGINEQPQTHEGLLLWGDCEFTGLPLAEGHKIIEIGVLVTDLSLRELGAYQSFVQYEWDEVEGLMNTNPWWDERKDDKARMRAGIEQGRPVQVVDEHLTTLAEAFFGDKLGTFCGNSVRNDLAHIDAELPSFAKRLDYRVIDVTTIKLIARRFAGLEYAGKKHNHFALDDIRESVEELKFLLGKLGIGMLSSDTV